MLLHSHLVGGVLHQLSSANPVENPLSLLGSFSSACQQFFYAFFSLVSLRLTGCLHRRSASLAESSLVRWFLTWVFHILLPWFGHPGISPFTALLLYLLPHFSLVSSGRVPEIFSVQCMGTEVLAFVCFLHHSCWSSYKGLYSFHRFTVDTLLWLPWERPGHGAFTSCAGILSPYPLAILLCSAVLVGGLRCGKLGISVILFVLDSSIFQW